MSYFSELDSKTRRSARETFRRLYPVEYNQLISAKTEQERYGIYEKMLADGQARLAAVVGEDNVDGSKCFSLQSDTYSQWKNATGDNIRILLEAQVNTLAGSGITPQSTPDVVAASFWTAGITGMGVAGVAAFNAAVGSGVATTLAMVAGVEALTVAGAAGVIAAVFVAIFLPILFFMLKPAVVYVAVINETSSSLYFQNDYNVHGKSVARVASIPAVFPLPDDPSYSVGIFVSSKRDDALVGTQYGFTMTVGDAPGVIFSYGAECPLTGIYVDNNCYAAFNVNSESVAKSTDNANVQSSSAIYQGGSSQQTYSSVINCNSASGSHAYYIARAKQS